MGNPKAIDLFAGCGGFSYGFEQENFDILLGVDNWDPALKTFKYNHRSSATINLDLHLDSSIRQIVNFLSGQSVDVIIAGPPCQGFSLTGTRDKNDKRNSLFEALFFRRVQSVGDGSLARKWCSWAKL